jgi:myosin heavy subunit
MSRKIEALQEAAAQKAQEALDRVEKALERMIKQGLTINFKTVADTANVSTAYLYKTPEIRERIETLRDQQKNQSKPKIAPTASDNSKSVIIYNLREEVKRVRSELEELKKINQALTGKLYQLQSADNLAERLKLENESLRQQVTELTQSLTECRANIPQKVTPITEAKRSQVSDRLKTALTAARIQLNPTLTKVIKAAKEEIVLSAIEAYKEAIAGGSIDRPGGWLKRAIEEEWKPNGAVQAKTELEIFNEWFSLAKKKGLVMASQQTKDGIIVCSSKGEWLPFGEMLTLHPLDTL